MNNYEQFSWWLAGVLDGSKVAKDPGLDPGQVKLIQEKLAVVMEEPVSQAASNQKKPGANNQKKPQEKAKASNGGAVSEVVKEIGYDSASQL